MWNHLGSQQNKVQYPTLQPIARKPVGRAIDSHAYSEIVFQHRNTPKYPPEIARDMGLSRRQVDEVIKDVWRKRLA
jgi:hypothetical protein